MTHIWREARGNFLTPGGDPTWECPVCGKSRHLYGVECPENYTHICKNCGAYLVYPWENNREKD